MNYDLNIMSYETYEIIINRSRNIKNLYTYFHTYYYIYIPKTNVIKHSL